MSYEHEAAERALEAEFSSEYGNLLACAARDKALAALLQRHHILFDEIAAVDAGETGNHAALRAQLVKERERVLGAISDFVIDAEEDRDMPRPV
jgi:hypothetical protein